MNSNPYMNSGGYEPPEKKKKINLTHTQEVQYSEEGTIATFSPSSSTISSNNNINGSISQLLPMVDNNGQITHTRSSPYAPESATTTKSSILLTNNDPIPNPVASNEIVNSLVFGLLNTVNKTKSTNVFGIGHHHRIAHQKHHSMPNNILDPNSHEMDLTSDSSDSDADDKNSTTSSSSSFSSLSSFSDSLPTSTIANPFSSTSTHQQIQKSPRRKSHRALIEKVKNLLLASPSSLSDKMDWDEVESLDRVYSCCGNNFFGQLSCGDKSRKPLLIQKLCRDSIKHIACGHGFVLIATVNNELYACGDNTYGQW